MMPVPNLMTMDQSASANLVAGNIQDPNFVNPNSMGSMGMNLFNGIYPGIAYNQIPGAQQQNPNPQVGNITDNINQ